MASENGKGAVASTSQSADGKRKSPNFVGERPVAGKNSTKLIGVRCRGVTVEVPRWYKDGKTHKTVRFDKRVEMTVEPAGTVHDFARLHENVEYAGNLNIDTLESLMREEQYLENDYQPIGKDLMKKYVKEHPLKYTRDKWDVSDKGMMDEVKEEIVQQGLDFYQKLKVEIAHKSTRLGIRRKDLGDIPPWLPCTDPQEWNVEANDAAREAMGMEPVQAGWMHNYMPLGY